MTRQTTGPGQVLSADLTARAELLSRVVAMLTTLSVNPHHKTQYLAVRAALNFESESIIPYSFYQNGETE